ncbi:MAG: alpha/beta fold hydrolase [Proteobacteria bacterium]|nr:alpha/beta fold hydrolase [Pseudomonadota bacterium]MBU1737240.1 alpha/beta fold hydrolase [Pseudomonadota bacterium]
MNDQPSSPRVSAQNSKELFSYSGEGRPAGHLNVFLPGWGFDGRIITLQEQVTDWLFPTKVISPEDTLRALAVYLEQSHINSVTLVGWSMGANLALDFAARHPDKIEALYLLGIRRSWPAGVINQIRSDLRQGRNSFLHNFYRKCFLGYRKAHETFTTDIAPSLLTNLKTGILEQGLDYLGDYNLENSLSLLAGSAFSTRIIHGGKDIIAPLSEAPHSASIPLTILEHGGHPVFLDPNFPFQLHNRKASIHSKFCRAADTYDAHAIIQKEIAVRMGELLPAETPARILEIGCGTGNYTKILHTRYPEAEITALDFASDMLARARAKLPPGSSVRYLCRDAEIFLNESEERFDLITSNATMQWFDNLLQACRNIRSLLTSEGRILLSIFGPKSMQEMREGLGAILGRTAPLPSTWFPDHDTLATIFGPLCRDLEIREWQTTREYETLSDLLEHIRKTGTSGWHPGRPLLTRSRMTELESWFVGKYGNCRTTYQVFQISGKRK